MKSLDILKITSVLLFLLFFSYFLQFLSPTLYGIDSYYHIKIAQLYKSKGLFREFDWTQFSIFKHVFADKSLLFHLLLIPFTYLPLISGGKYGVIFLNFLYLIIFVLIFKRKLSPSLLILSLLLPFFSLSFLNYWLYLRPQILANILTLLIFYFLLEKKWIKVAAVSFIFVLSHLSFPLALVFAILIESLRYLKNKEFFFKNILGVVLGMSIAILIHPQGTGNFLLIFYFNGIVVPLFSFLDLGEVLKLGLELFPVLTNELFIKNLLIFLSLIAIIFHYLIFPQKLSLDTLCFFTGASFYSFLGIFSYRFWYPAVIFITLFIVFYLKDNYRKIKLKKILLYSLILVIGLSLFELLTHYYYNSFTSFVKSTIERNLHYQRVAYWMRKNIPEGELIYHAYWSDSPFFICMNPKNKYFVVLDPIFMWARDSKKYYIYSDLGYGKIINSWEVLKKVFKVKYGYARKSAGIYKRIKEDKKHFEILYEDKQGIVFRLK